LSDDEYFIYKNKLAAKQKKIDNKYKKESPIKINLAEPMEDRFKKYIFDKNWASYNKYF
jgi:hypothetical protein